MNMSRDDVATLVNFGVVDVAGGGGGAAAAHWLVLRIDYIYRGMDISCDVHWEGSPRLKLCKADTWDRVVHILYNII